MNTSEVKLLDCAEKGIGDGAAHLSDIIERCTRTFSEQEDDHSDVIDSLTKVQSAIEEF